MSATVTHLWKPSNARYLKIDGFLATARGPQIPPPQALVWPEKDPSDTLDYVFDIGPALAADLGDGIVSLEVQISPSNPGDLTLLSSAVEGTKVVLWMSGGQTQTVYTITITAGTAGGRTLGRSVMLPVVQLAFPFVTPDALTITTDQPLTDPEGVVITTI